MVLPTVVVALDQILKAGLVATVVTVQAVAAVMVLVAAAMVVLVVAAVLLAEPNPAMVVLAAAAPDVATGRIKLAMVVLAAVVAAVLVEIHRKQASGLAAMALFFSSGLKGIKYEIRTSC